MLGNIAKIDELWAYAQAKAGAEDFKNALKALPPLRKFLDDAAALADETARTIAEDQNDLLAVWTQEEAELGPMATLLIEEGGCEVRVVVGSVRTQNADQAMFRHIGIDPTTQDIAVINH